MSNYKSHNLFNCVITFPLFILIAYKFFSPTTKELCLFSFFYFYTTFFMSPDMDISHKIKLFSLRGFLTFPFRLYSRIFKHRGLSHFFFIGSLTRIFWLCLWGLLILYLFNIAFDKSSLIKYILSHPKQLLWSSSAIFLADFSHIILDKIKK